MDTEHAPLPPSDAARWVACSGSATMQAAHPEIPGSADAQARLEGNAAHHAASETLNGRPVTIGTTAPNGVVITDEMMEAVETYIDDVRDVLAPLRALNAVFHIEERVNCNWIHADNWGTPDLWIFLPQGQGGLLLLWDFKYGHGFVDAFENWQAIDYISGVLSRPEFRNADLKLIKTIITIVQPRNYHPVGPIRRWTSTAFELSGYWQTLRDAAFTAMGAEPICRPGPHCGNCTARHACATLHAAADNVADISGGAVSLELPPVALGAELRFLTRAADILDARITGLKAQAEADLRAGKPVPFWQLMAGQSREVWTADAATVQALGEALGVDVMKPPLPVTPNQARKAGLDKDIVASLSERPHAGLKLAAATNDQARKVFAAPASE